jgi:adenylosuccinate synthase
MPLTMIVGGQFGGEGKGKITSYLALMDKPWIVARAGGPNAGHTVVLGGRTLKFRMLPSGAVSPRGQLLLGPGSLLDPEILLREASQFGVASRIGIDPQAGIIETSHIDQERRNSHLSSRIGSTCSGTGMASAARAQRTLRRACDVPALLPYLADVPARIQECLSEKAEVLAEGTQGFGLSLFHGTYPYVTSYDTSASALASSLGIGPKRVDRVVLVLRTFAIRVAPGPLSHELSVEESTCLGIREYGTVTGRLRRVGRFDLGLAKRAVMINSPTEIALTGLDYLDPSCRGVREIGRLSKGTREYIETLERELGVRVTLISTGPDTWDTIDVRNPREEHLLHSNQILIP